MDFLTCGYKIRLILSKEGMCLKEIAALHELIDIGWGPQKLGITFEKSTFKFKECMIKQNMIFLKVVLITKKNMIINCILYDKDNF